MQIFQTPVGKAGSDRLDAMVKSIQAAIEQMFWQVAKRDSLNFGVGRTTGKTSSDPNRKMQLESQKRECDGLIVFHAGKALETALQVVYAKINDRIRGREHPESSKNQMKKDRGTHGLKSLYNEILDSTNNNSGLREDIEKEFESIYQTVYHEGVNDLIVEDEVVYQFFHVEDAPFREVKIGSLSHGAESTLDHSGFDQVMGFEREKSKFSLLPCGIFPEFLAKADSAYYGGRNMRWAHYSARDHEPGRLYTVIGSRFFARLIQGIVQMADEQWMWHEAFKRRWHERRQELVRTSVHANIQQSFVKSSRLPDPKPVDEMMEWFDSQRPRRTDNHDSLHSKLRIERKSETSENCSSANNGIPSEGVD